MTVLKDREESFEKKFVIDEELKFKAGARRNKLLGLWAAGIMDKSGDEAEAYARKVVVADFEEAGDEDVFRKVRGHLDADTSDKEIRDAMSRLMGTAIDQIQSE